MAADAAQTELFPAYTPSVRPRREVAAEATDRSITAPSEVQRSIDPEASEIDFTPPAQVRPAPDAAPIQVAHVAAGVRDGVYVGREVYRQTGSPLGNPFQGPDAIERFRAWLKAAIRAVAGGVGDLAQQQAVAELERLRDLLAEGGRLTLVCWCAPHPCHADVIAAAIIWLLERTPVPVPAGLAIWDRPCAAEGLPWVVLGANGRVVRAAATLAQARAPLATQAFAPDAAPRRGEYPVPTGAAVETCRSCGAHVVWARTAGGRAIPLSVATIQRRAGVAYALAHFSDCPHGKDWSR